MATTVQKWGNSLGIRLPKFVAEQVNLSQGSEIEFDIRNGMLTIMPRRTRTRKHKLAELLAQFKPRHRHGELNDSPPIGRELI